MFLLQEEMSLFKLTVGATTHLVSSWCVCDRSDLHPFGSTLNVSGTFLHTVPHLDDQPYKSTAECQTATKHLQGNADLSTFSDTDIINPFLCVPPGKQASKT